MTDGTQAPSTAMAIAYSTAAKAADAVLDAFDFLSGTRDKDKVTVDSALNPRDHDIFHWSDTSVFSTPFRQPAALIQLTLARVQGHAKPAKKVEAKKSPLDIAVAVVAEEGETYKSSGRLACAKRRISR